MTDFTLSNNNQIRGDQLVDEILQGVGVDLADQYTFSPPNIVRVPDSFVEGIENEIQAIIDNHVPDPLYFQEDRNRIIQQNAESDARNIPNWSTWTEAEAKSWFDSNISDLLSTIPDIDTLTDSQYDNNAKTIDSQFQDVLNSMAQMNWGLVRILIAMRNRLWPNL